MLHRSAPFRHTPDQVTKAELNSIGLGDPTVSLRRLAVRDLVFVGAAFLIAFAVASYFDISEWYREAAVKYEDWEFDEIAIAAIISTLAFCWFSWRQWRRYADEVSRRLKLEEDMVEMRVIADHLCENKALFLANLAHDFRTPLNGILGFAQLLEEAPFGPIGNDRYVTYIKTIRESANMLSERIETCLDPEKIEFGSEPMQMIAYPLKNAVNSAMPVLTAMARSATITIQDEVSDDLPDLHADGRALKKIIVNLVTNAIKHSRPRGTVRIAAALTEDKGLKLTVRDDGVGMDPKLVDMLNRTGTAVGSPGGTSDMTAGVGLSVVKRLLEMHDARFTIETSATTGTTATAIFPPGRVIPGSN